MRRFACEEVPGNLATEPEVIFPHINAPENSDAMTDWLDYSIPVWHPIAVHVPVVLLPLAAVFALLWVTSAGRQWFAPMAIVLALAVAGTAFAYWTGDAVYQQSEGVPVVEDLVGIHRQLGRIVLIASVLSFALTVLSMPQIAAIAPAARRRLRLLVLLVVIVAAGLSLVTGHIGGIMVWGEYTGE